METVYISILRLATESRPAYRRYRHIPRRYEFGDPKRSPQDDTRFAKRVSTGSSGSKRSDEHRRDAICRRICAVCWFDHSTVSSVCLRLSERGFIGPRPTNYIDLQYLYYSPFCMVFISNDRFHRDMWPATAGVHSFLWGQDVKDDLSRRVGAGSRGRNRRQESLRRRIIRVRATAQSVIAEMWGRYMRETRNFDQAGQAKTIDDLEPEIQQQLKDAMKEFDRMDRRGDKH